MNHLPITQSSVIALISQVVAFVAGFGIIDSTKTGIVISIATAVVNAAFLIANSLHHQASARVEAAQYGVQLALPAPVVVPDPAVVPPVLPAAPVS